MNLGDFRTKFKARLNRSDCTDTLALDFIDEAIKRVHRELRVRQMETVGASLTVDANSRLTIPTDFIEMKGLWPTDGTKLLTKKQLDDFLRFDANNSNCEIVYTRRGGYWYLKPTQAENTAFTLDYYAKTGLTIADLTTDSAFLSDAYDLYLFAALSAAANHFEDDREVKWETQFQDRLNTLNTLAEDQDLAEGVQVVAPGTDTEY